MTNQVKLIEASLDAKRDTKFFVAITPVERIVVYGESSSLSDQLLEVKDITVPLTKYVGEKNDRA